MNGMTLIIPPLFEPSMPLLGPYQMAGYAKAENIDLDVIDYNAEFVRHIIDSAKEDLFVAYEDEQRLFEVNACKQFLSTFEINNFDDLKRRLEQCVSPREYWSLIDYVRCCYDLYSLRFTGLRFRMEGFDTAYDWSSWPEVESFVSDYSDSLLFARIRSWVSKYHIGADNNRLIGINVTFDSQLYFAILLCNAIHENSPDSVVSIGGSFINSFIDSPESTGPLAKYFNIIMSGEGEALLHCLQTLGDCPVSALISYGQKTSGKAVYISASDLCKERLRVYPPEFELRNQYLSPSKVIPLRFTCQCYWGKCKFCSDKENHSCLDSQYNFDDIISYCITKHRCKDFDCIYFLDSAIPPRFLERFADAMIASGESFLWGTNVRADKPFTDEEFIKKLAKSGCVFVKFGLESGSQNVLDLMNKGITVEDAAKFISLCRKYHIYVHTYIMFAFPGETEADRLFTRDFLLSGYSHPDSYNCSEFILYGSAPIAKEMNCDFMAEEPTDGWHGISYSLTSDAIKQSIVSMRRAFDEKYPNAKVLISTGHTIALSRKMRNPAADHVTLSSNSVLHISNLVVAGKIGKEEILGKWRRRDGVIFIQGSDVHCLKEKINNKRVSEAIGSGISASTVFKLLDEDFITFDDADGERVECSGEQQFHFSYGLAFSNMHWYGYYDVN